MTKLIMQKRAINNITKENYRKLVSIQFSLDGFSFCITNSATKEIHHFSHYTFDKTLATPELLLTQIESIVKDNSLLHQDFETVNIIHQNNLCTLVPKAFYDETQVKEYLKYNIKILANDFIASDYIDKIAAYNVYVPYVNINNFFFQQFGEFEYKHHSTVLIDKLIQHIAQENPEKYCFINVAKTNFDMVVIENSKLLLYNNFSYATKEDFIYYILFTATQLKLDPETFSLQFLGAIEKDSELYKITYQYIRNVSFISLDVDFFNSDEDISNYSHFTTIA